MAWGCQLQLLVAMILWQELISKCWEMTASATCTCVERLRFWKSKMAAEDRDAWRQMMQSLMTMIIIIIIIIKRWCLRWHYHAQNVAGPPNKNDDDDESRVLTFSSDDVLLLCTCAAGCGSITSSVGHCQLLYASWVWFLCTGRVLKGNVFTLRWITVVSTELSPRCVQCTMLWFGWREGHSVCEKLSPNVLFGGPIQWPEGMVMALACDSRSRVQLPVVPLFTCMCLVHQAI